MRDMKTVKILKVKAIMGILMDIKNIHNLSFRDLEQELEVSRSTLQRYADGSIIDINYEVITKITDYIYKMTGDKVCLNTVTTMVAEERIILNEITSLMRKDKKNRIKLRKFIEILKVDK